MSGNNKNKNKGCAFERSICKILSKHLGGSFIRTPHSGAYLGGTNHTRAVSKTQSTALKSDIIPPDELSLLNIECKSYKDFSFSGLLKNKNATFEKWLNQLRITATEDSKDFLIFKINREGTFIAFEHSYIYQAYFSIWSRLIYYFPTKEIDNVRLHTAYIITPFDTFLENNINQIKRFCSPES